MSYHCFSKITRRARTQARCIWCGQQIEPGSQYVDERSVYDGAFQHHRWHPECIEDANDWLDGCDEFLPYSNDRPVLEVKK